MNEDYRLVSHQPAVDLTQHGAPIYVQLASLFRRFIVTGQWPLEQQIPTHEDIAAQFDVNPATVRKAMAMLESEGLVQRFRRRGTFVTAKPSDGESFLIPTRWEELLAAFDGLTSRTLDTRKVRSVPAPFHECVSQAKGYLYARKLYRRGTHAVVLEDSYLDASVGAAARLHPLRRLEKSKSHPIKRAEETLRFGIADRDVAQALDIPLNAPVAMAHISVFGIKGLLHYESVSYFRGDMARVSEAIRFEGAGR
jgi:GntR family transcriptional regulator